jgi:hypothetical protein
MLNDDSSHVAVSGPSSYLVHLFSTWCVKDVEEV